MPFSDNAKTLFVERRDGSISGCWTVRQYPEQEELLVTDPALVAFLNPPAPTADDREAAALAALNGGGASGAVDQQKLQKAIVVNFTARALGVAPGALTPAQLLAERNRIAAIYKNL